MLEWSIEALRAVPDVREIVVALPAGAQAPAGTTGVTGGEHRSQSVLAAHPDRPGRGAGARRQRDHDLLDGLHLSLIHI